MMISCFSLLLSILFIPGISGAGTTPRWALACVVLPILIMLSSREAVNAGGSRFSRDVARMAGQENKGSTPAAPHSRGSFTAAHLCGLIFIWYAAISISWSPQHWDGLDALVKLIVIAEAFVLGSMIDLKPILIGFGLGMWVNSAVMLLGINVPHTTDNAGLFVNSNAMGEIAGLVLVAIVAQRLWWLIPGILPAFLLSQCRGAFVAVAGAGMIWLWNRSRWAVAALIPLGLAAVTAFGSAGSIHDRLTLWTDILPHLTIMGHGLGSFFTMYPTYSSFDTLIQRPEHLHNDWLEYAFETGVIGIAALLCCVWCSRSIVLCALGIEAMFGFPLHMAATAVLGGLIAGHAVRGRRGIRHLFHDWRDTIRGWRANVTASHSRLPPAIS